MAILFAGKANEAPSCFARMNPTKTDLFLLGNKPDDEAVGLPNLQVVAVDELFCGFDGRTVAGAVKFHGFDEWASGPIT
jgi:hypothetical protein